MKAETDTQLFDAYDENNKLQKTKLVKYDLWEVGFNENYKNHDMIMIDIGK